MPEIYLALDVPTAREAEPIAKALQQKVSGFKVGGELFLAEGPAICDLVVGIGSSLFIDLKLHDIPRTVQAGAKRLAKLGASIITVHAFGGLDMMRAAVEGASVNSKTRVVAVTVLTSHNSLRELGISDSIPQQVERLAGLAIKAGVHGFVCSVHEAKMLREAHGSIPLIVTPGIRLPGGDAHDQQRAATPAEAVQAGSDVLVIGRAVLDAADRQAALDAVKKSAHG